MAAGWLDPLPLIAILRGVRPGNALAIARALTDVGFHMLEVPLNSPEPLQSIHHLANALDARCLVGAGTVMNPRQVTEVARAGGRLIVMPHSDTRVIRAAKSAGVLCVPGVATPSEAFAALEAGADALKLFPAGQVSPSDLKAWRAVLPADVPILPVGGINADNMRPWIAAGAQGFGIGSALFVPAMSAEEVARHGRTFARAWADATTAGPPHREYKR